MNRNEHCSDLHRQVGEFIASFSEIESVLVHYITLFVYVRLNAIVDLKAVSSQAAISAQLLLEDLTDFLLADSVFKNKLDKYCCLANFVIKEKTPSQAKQLFSRLGRLRAKLMELSDFRNAVAHSRWAYSRLGATSRNVRTSSGAFKVERDRINKHTLQQNITFISSCLVALSKFHIEILEC